jgi:hypothetical protein
MTTDNSAYELKLLAHQGFVSDEDEIQSQTNARKVVREAMSRASLNLPASIIWMPINFSPRRDSRRDFCERIKDGVEGLIADEQQSPEETDYAVFVEHLNGRRFEVYMIRNSALRC